MLECLTLAYEYSMEAARVRCNGVLLQRVDDLSPVVRGVHGAQHQAQARALLRQLDADAAGTMIEALIKLASIYRQGCGTAVSLTTGWVKALAFAAVHDHVRGFHNASEARSAIYDEVEEAIVGDADGIAVAIGESLEEAFQAAFSVAT